MRARVVAALIVFSVFLASAPIARAVSPFDKFPEDKKWSNSGRRVFRHSVSVNFFPLLDSRISVAYEHMLLRQISVQGILEYGQFLTDTDSATTYEGSNFSVAAFPQYWVLNFAPYGLYVGPYFGVDRQTISGGTISTSATGYTLGAMGGWGFVVGPVQVKAGLGVGIGSRLELDKDATPVATSTETAGLLLGDLRLGFLF